MYDVIYILSKHKLHFSYLHKSVDVSCILAHCPQLVEDPYGVLSGQECLLVELEDSNGKPEQYFTAFVEESVPDP